MCKVSIWFACSKLEGCPQFGGEVLNGVGTWRCGEMSSFHRMICTGSNGVGMSLLQKVPHFRGCYSNVLVLKDASLLQIIVWGLISGRPPTSHPSCNSITMDVFQWKSSMQITWLLSREQHCWCHLHCLVTAKDLWSSLPNLSRAMHCSWQAQFRWKACSALIMYVCFLKWCTCHWVK